MCECVKIYVCMYMGERNRRGDQRRLITKEGKEK